MVIRTVVWKKSIEAAYLVGFRATMIVLMTYMLAKA